MTTTSEKPKYISNRELLVEIAKSKATYCWLSEPSHIRFDAIVARREDITPAVIAQAQAKRASFLHTKEKPVTAASIPVGDLVFRVTTSEHIPEDPTRKKRGGDPNTPANAKTNFPPFKHYMLKGKSLVEVVRSHWKGGPPPGGQFTIEQGKMTRRLADMLMLLVERYALRSNWRGYCVDEETEALTTRGWLRHDQITEADTILSFDGETLRWSPVRSIFRDQYDGLMFRMTVAGLDALVTPGHKFVTEDGLVRIEDLTEAHRLILSARHDLSGIEVPPAATCAVGQIDFHGARKDGRIWQPTISYKGTVWCPKTDYGCFLSRRNGCVYLTGNTYVDEMRSHALLQLSQIALQFDESKSENPFAFYTTSIRNCLAGDTVILTRDHGAVPIETIVGQEVHLLDGNGEWVLCPIIDYGEQETQELVFQGGYEAVRIRSTLKHGWITPENERLLTEDFLGHHRAVADLRPKKTVTDMAAYRRGVVHGLVYGDGSAHSVRSFIIRLCGGKASLAPLMEGHDRAGWEEPGGDPIFIVREPWANLKALPEKPGEDPDYLLGFLRGWMATDGCVSESTNATLCGDRAEYEWVSRWGPLVGWHTRGFSALAARTNFGERKKASGNMRLKKHSLCAEDFLNPKHRERRGEIDPPAVVWRTYSQKQDKTKRRVERVYCPYVPTTNSMALGSGIHSAQCFTRVLNLEKRNQHIRDDLLIMAGARPSYARQIADEEMQRAQAAVAERAAQGESSEEDGA